jgi:hypothetical protein
MHDPEKRDLRRLKREIKRAGNKRRRQHLKRDLEEHPEEAQHSEYEFRRLNSATMNGMDNDATRKKKRDDAPTRGTAYEQEEVAESEQDALANQMPNVTQYRR